MKRKIEFIVVDPGGNVTVLATTDVPRAERIVVANKLLSQVSIRERGAEQVGFVDLKNKILNLEMTNGELCINAIRCAGALATWKSGRSFSKLRSSGLTGLVEIKAEESGNSEYYVEAKFGPSIIKKVVNEKLVIDSESIDCKLVYLSGIAQLLADWDTLPFSIKKLFSDKNKGLNSSKITDFKLFFDQIYRSKKFLVSQSAVGFVAFQRLTSTKYRIWPLVKVNGLKTIFYETACGSASLALVYTQRSSAQGQEFEVMQPSGKILEISISKPDIFVRGEAKILLEDIILI
jgi:diaminopimelate epimerase